MKNFFFHNFLMHLISMFIVLDPFGVLLGFITFTKGKHSKYRVMIIKDILIASLILGGIFAVGGLWILKCLSLTLADLKIGGGIVFLVASINVILKEQEDPQIKEPELVGIVPLATPLIVGPGVIANIILLSKKLGVFPAMIVYIIILSFTMLLLLYSEKILYILGKRGIIAISKVFAILMVGIAVMYIRRGIIEIVSTQF